MRYEMIYFTLDELVCEHVYDFYGETAWQFFDQRLLQTIDILRQKLNKPIFVNNWQVHGSFDERGFRCPKCSIVKEAVKQDRMYISPHMTGQAVDFDVEGMLAEETRQWIVKNQRILPYPIRLEAGVSWVHLDTRDANKGMIYLFKP